MAISTMGITTEMAYALATVIGAKTLGGFKSNTVAARLVLRDWDPLTAKLGSVVRVNRRGALTAYAKAEHTEVTLNQPAFTPIDVTLNQHWEVSFEIEDMARALAGEGDYIEGYAGDAAKALSEKVDATILGLYASMTGSIDATGASGPLAAEDFIEARRLLNAAKAPLTDRFAILHEDAEAEFQAIDEVVNRSYSERTNGMPNAQAESFAARFKGFDVYLNQQVTVTGSVCKNIFGHKYALALATRPLPPAPSGLGVAQNVIDEDGVGVRVTISYDPKYLSVVCTVDTLFGVAAGIAAFGVTVGTSEV